jgi:hypothetical protein
MNKPYSWMVAWRKGDNTEIEMPTKIQIQEVKCACGAVLVVSDIGDAKDGAEIVLNLIVEEHECVQVEVEATR